VNIRDGTRWNSALAYLDPVRAQTNLTIISDALVDRVELDGSRARGISFLVGGRRRRVAGDRIVLSAGAYGSPGILQRSGIGPADLLRNHGVEVVREMPGVGSNLADHPSIEISFRGSGDLDAEMDRFEATGWLPDEQVLAKTRSSLCTDAFDLHLYAVTGRDPDDRHWIYNAYASCVAPRSSGAVHITSSNPEEPPVIEHGYLTDLDGHDRRVLAEGIELVRRIMRPAIESGALIEELRPGADRTSASDLEDYVNRSVGIYYHPASTCRMGPSTDSTAVVDSLGRVHGFENLWVCDASIFPVLMRANTNLPSAMVAEHLAPVIAAGR
jgi:choline dehydrogenase